MMSTLETFLTVSFTCALRVAFARAEKCCNVRKNESFLVLVRQEKERREIVVVEFMADG